MDTGSVLGVPAVRPTFLDHLSAARAAETESRRGADDMSTSDPAHEYSEEVHAWFADDDEDDIDDDFEDEFGDDDDDDDEEDEEENSEDPETWQVFGRPKLGRKRRGLRLTSVPERA